VPKTETIRDIPESQKQRIDDDYKAVGATTVWTKQADGRWTVTATFPGKATEIQPSNSASGGTAAKKPSSGG
jgi:hypothetical protein